ncbi:hypothetical protein SprV_0501965800 [Sparganum proliferum]
MLRQLHDGMTARVMDNRVVSEVFAVTSGAKQGCVLAPTLFSLMFSSMLIDAYRYKRPGILVAYRTGEYTSSRMYPQLPSTSFSSRTTEPSKPPQKETCKGAWISSPPPVIPSARSATRGRR